MMPAQAAKLLGLQQLAADCGLDSVLPHAWVERVRAVLPGHGKHSSLPQLAAAVSAAALWTRQLREKLIHAVPQGTSWTGTRCCRR